MFGYQKTKYDVEVYENELKDFLPDNIVDAHAHIWRVEDDEFDRSKFPEKWTNRVAGECPIEDLLQTYKDFFPGKKVIPVVFGNSVKRCAYHNAYVKSVKEKYGFKVRVNTNGLGNLINQRDITPELCEVADVISISLNAPDAERYLKITRNDFGLESFDAMLDFTKKCVEKNANVRMTVVDVITEEEIKQCAKLAESLGAKFVSREYTTQ